MGLNQLADTKYAEYDRLVNQARASSSARHALKEHELALNASGVSPSLLGARSHAHHAGIRTDPIMPTRVLGLNLR